MKLGVYDGKSKIKDIEVQNVIGEISETALYQVVVSRMTHDRSGNAFTKTKSEVRGGGKKPWKQKGLGRARAGSIRSPLWKGGGVTFGPKPRDFSLHINKKQKSKAYITAFSKLFGAERLKVITGCSIDSGKTKDMVQFLGNYVENRQENVVVIVADYDQKAYLSSRNLENVDLLCLSNLDILPLVHADWVLISEKAILELDSRYSKIFQ